jgi:hypothetical protein
MRSGIFWLLILAASISSGCSGSSPKSSSALSASFQVPTVPTKDDVLWVDGRRLTLSGYLALRDALPSNLSRDSVLWIAIAAFSIQNDALIHGREIPLKTAVALALYASDLSQNPGMEADTERLKPEDYRIKIDRLISKSMIQRNPQVLAEIH